MWHSPIPQGNKGKKIHTNTQSNTNNNPNPIPKLNLKPKLYPNPHWLKFR